MDLSLAISNALNPGIKKFALRRGDLHSVHLNAHVLPNRLKNLEFLAKGKTSNFSNAHEKEDILELAIRRGRNFLAER